MLGIFGEQQFEIPGVCLRKDLDLVPSQLRPSKPTTKYKDLGSWENDFSKQE